MLHQKPGGATDVLRHLKFDALSSIVVFLVALPLCMGIAIAAGMPVTSGLVTGIIGGLVVAPLSGAPLQVSGPGNGTIVSVFEIVQQHGVPVVGLIVMLAGAMQLVAGSLRLAQWFRAVSPTVIHAMLTGIGILIAAGQLHVMVDDRPRESGLKNLLTIPEALAKGLPWPGWGSRDENIQRAELLRKFGSLHETQQELTSAVTVAVGDLDPNQAEEELAVACAPLASRQRELQTRLEELIEQASGQRLFGNDTRRDQKFRAALAGCAICLRSAGQDLEHQRLAALHHSQVHAAIGIADVLQQLKSHDWAAKIGLLSIGVIVLWNLIPLRQFKAVPATLVAVVVAMLFANQFAIPVNYVEIPDRLSEGILFPSLAALHGIPFKDLLVQSLLIAVVASAETLLSASAVDNMQPHVRTRYDRELVAQGIGNLVCGALGGLPMTGVIIRSAANVQAGARTRMSSFLHGLWMLLCVLALSDLLQRIPTACMAGILVFTGYRLIDFRTARRLWDEDKFELVIFLTTVATILCDSLLTGVIVGTILAAVKLLLMFSHLEADLDIDARTNKAHLALSGAATFLRLPIFATALESVPASAELHVDMRRLSYIDKACLELLLSWSRQHESQGGRVVIDWNQLQTRVDTAAHSSALRTHAPGSVPASPPASRSA